MQPSDPTAPKPCKINFADLPWESYVKGRFGSEDKYLTTHTRARKLDCALTRLAPGQVSTPYHFHQVDEELFIVLSGKGKLRMDGRDYEIGPDDLIACPAGPTGAHQFTNDGTEPLTYLAISTESPVEICEYPDSDKLLVFVKDNDKSERSRIYKRSTAVDYWQDEPGSG